MGCSNEKDTGWGEKAKVIQDNVRVGDLGRRLGSEVEKMGDSGGFDARGDERVDCREEDVARAVKRPI